MDDVVFSCERWGHEHQVPEANCIGDGDGLGVFAQQCKEVLGVGNLREVD